MCKHGNDVFLSVPIPAHLSHTGKFRWDVKAIDSCIAPIVQALNDAGIYTASCCCGHGASDGNIILHDGRILIVRSAPNTACSGLACTCRKNLADEITKYHRGCPTHDPANR